MPLALKGGSSHVTVKAHAIRLGLDIAHLRPRQSDAPATLPDLCPDLTYLPSRSNLPRAGPMLAGAWFTLCGHDVSWPLEPCRFDLLVVLEKPVKIQVKTARVRASKTWVARISSSGPSDASTIPTRSTTFSSSTATWTTTSFPWPLSAAST